MAAIANEGACERDEGVYSGVYSRRQHVLALHCARCTLFAGFPRRAPPKLTLLAFRERTRSLCELRAWPGGAGCLVCYTIRIGCVYMADFR